MRRAQIDDYSQTVRNLAYNPNFVTTTSPVTQRTNLVTNPDFEGISGTVNVRTNLLTNPNLETVGSTNVTVRTNLCTNPSMEAGAGSSTTRTNLVVSPRGVSALPPYASATTITPNVAISGHPEGFTTAIRVSYASTDTNPGVALLNPVEAGVSYFISAWVYHETIPGAGTQGFAQAGVASMPSPPTIVQGVWKKITWLYTSSGTAGIGFRVSAQNAAGAFLITGMQMEKSSIALPYFDALTTTTNKLVNPSMEQTSGSTTLRTNLALNPNSVLSAGWFGAYSLSYSTLTNQPGGPTGSSYARVKATSLSATATGYFAVAYGQVGGSAAQVTAGNTYVASAWVRATLATYAQPSFRLRWKDSQGNTLGDVITQATGTTSGSWSRLSASGVAPSGTSYVEIMGGYVSINYGTLTLTDSIDMAGVLVETGNYVNTYFDGTTSASGDITHGWNGTANSSTSWERSFNVAWWSSRWFGSTGGAGYYFRSANTGVSGGYSFRKVWTQDNTGSAQDVGIAQVIPVVEGATYTSSIYQKSSVDQYLTCFIDWLDTSGATIIRTTLTGVSSPAGVWVRGTVTSSAPAGAVSGRFVYGPYTSGTAMPAGSYIDWDWAMIEESPVLRVYQDGTANSPGDFTYAWAGTTHNSSSYQKMVGVTSYTSSVNCVVGQSSEWSEVGSKSLKVVATNTSKDSYAMVPFTLAAKTYTITATCRLESAQTNVPESRARKIVVYHSNAAAGGTVNSSNQAANAAGTTQVSVTFTVTDASQYQSIRLYNGAAQGEGDVWWDSLLIEEADHVMPYFDGSTQASQDMAHSWSGAAHNSTSLMTVNMPSGVSNSGYRYGMQSTEWSARGSKSVKIPHLFAAGGTNNDNFVEIQGMISGGLKVNTTYTLSATCRTSQVLGGTINGSAFKFVVNIGSTNIPVTYTSTKSNTAGVARVVGSFTTGASTSINFLRLMAGATYGNGDVWWDELCLEEGLTDGSYFDGGYSSKENIVKSSPTALSQAGLVTGVSFAGATWTRLYNNTYGNGYGQMRILMNLADLSQGAPYTIGMTVYNESSVDPITIIVDWCDGPSQTWVLAPGETRRLVGTFAARASGYSTVYRFIDIGVSQSLTTLPTALFKAFSVERGTTSGEYYAGSEFTPVWAGASDASTSYLRAPQLTQWGQATTAQHYQTPITSYFGTKSAGILTRGTNGDGFYHNDINVTEGVTYTSSCWIKLTAAVPTLSGVLRWKDASANIIYDSGAPIHTQLTVGSWTRVSVSAVAPTGATKLQPMWRIYASHTPTTFYVDGALIEASPKMLDYFDGNTPASGDFTYGWTGLAQNTSSFQTAKPIVGQAANKSSGAVDSKFLGYQTITEDGGKAARFVAPAGTANSVWRVASLNTAAFDYTKIKAGGVYTLLFKWRSYGWPVNNTMQVSISYGTAQNRIMDPSTFNLNQTGWAEYRRTFTAQRDADAGQMIYISLPVTPSATTDGIFDMRDWMLVEGEYTGDLVKGSNPFSRWEGAADNSLSLGYPPQLRDLVGNPVLDLTVANGLEQALPGGYSNTEGRTFYTVFEGYQMPGASVIPLITYGATGLTDSPANQTIMLRMQGSSAAAVLNRRTGGGGPQVGNVALQNRNVTCWGLTDTGTQFIMNNGSATVVQTTVMDVPHQSVRVSNDSTLNGLPATKHIRTIMFRGYHDDATKLAVSRYLANKYGVYVP